PMTNAPTRYDAERGSSSGLGVAGLILGSIAIFIAWIPCVNFVAALMAVVGLALAGVGLFSAMGDKRVARGLPIAGVIASGLALVVFVASFVVLGILAQRGVEKVGTEIGAASAQARVELTERAGELLDEAAELQKDDTLTDVERDALTNLTDRVAAELEDQNAGIFDNVAFGLLLAELEARIQLIKKQPTTMPSEALDQLPGTLFER
ncbi:MAG: hypothetical protein AAF656_09220, partial [Planctomycetota bacterium]